MHRSPLVKLHVLSSISAGANVGMIDRVSLTAIIFRVLMKSFFVADPNWWHSSSAAAAADLMVHIIADDSRRGGHL